MKRGRSRRPHNGSTLSEALSPDERGKLLRLRGTLEQSADEAFSRRLAEARPPWRGTHKPASAVKTPATKPGSRDHPRNPLNAARKQPVPPRADVQFKPEQTQSPGAESQPAGPVFAYWDFPHEAPAANRFLRPSPITRNRFLTTCFDPVPSCRRRPAKCCSWFLASTLARVPPR